MATLLIPGEVTPTVRFGIRQHSTGHLRACSPCCGRSMTGYEAQCKGCGQTWEGARPGAYQITGDVMVLPGDDMALIALREWAENLTGHSLTLEVVS